MNMPTSSAPHICLKVRRNTSPNCEPESLPMAPSSIATMIHEARIAVPAIQGVNLNVAVILVFSSGAAAATDALYQVTFGSGDQGPVQAATTTSSTTNGIQASINSPPDSPCERCWATCAVSIGVPPYPMMVLGCQTFSSSSSAT